MNRFSSDKQKDKQKDKQIKHIPVCFLLTCGGGPGILAQVEALRTSKKYKARIILADANPASGNLFLPEVDARYHIPECTAGDFIPSLLRLIGNEKVDFIYSGLDEEIPILAKNRALIEDKNCMLLSPSEQALKTALDKKETFHVLKDRVLQPKTFFLDGLVDYGKIYNELSGRVVIKITSSRGGRDIYFPEDEEEYEFYLRRIEKMNKEREFMIQEAVDGDEFNVTCLHDIEGKSVYSFSRRKFEKRKIKSTTTAAVIETQTDVIEQALMAIEVLKLKPGFNNVEIIRSREDGKPYFIEVNGGRTAAQDMNIVAAGVNITDLMMDILRGEPVEPIDYIQQGLASLKIRKDVIVNYSDIASVARP